jgi:hypothetical protein
MGRILVGRQLVRNKVGVQDRGTVVGETFTKLYETATSRQNDGTPAKSSGLTRWCKVPKRYARELEAV